MTFDKSRLIAVVGVSRDRDKFGHRIFSSLLSAGYNAEGINAAGGEAAGRRLCRSLSELPLKPELVITVVPPAVTLVVVDECIALGVKSIWMQPGSGSDDAAKKAEDAGISVINGACFMVKNGIW